MKIYLVGAESFSADRQTISHDEANIRFSKYCKGAKNLWKKLPTIICKEAIGKTLKAQNYKEQLIMLFSA
jgi:hypothetical protein